MTATLTQIAETNKRKAERKECPLSMDYIDCKKHDKPECKNGNYRDCGTYQIIMEIRT